MSKDFAESGLMLQGPSAPDYPRCARLAEDLDFGALWIPQDPSFNGAFAFVLAIVAQTTRIKIWLGGLNPYLRHSAAVAMELGMLDRLSSGRSILRFEASVKLVIEECWVPYRRPLATLMEAVL